MQMEAADREPLNRYEDAVVRLMVNGARRKARAKDVRLISHPLLRALAESGTAHIYADTADIDELSALVVEGETSDAVYLYSEIDGNTTNQALFRKVFERYLDNEDGNNVASWLGHLRLEKPSLTREEATIALYSIINARLGLEVLNHFSAARPWNVSLELHTALARDPEAAASVGRCLSAAVPDSFVKVAFTPDHPQCFLIARDLERAGVPVNFTATFSARQVVAAAMLANPHRTNIFMGRLSQGLEAEMLGEHVLLQAQRQMRRLRRGFGVSTLNMAASVRRWQTIPLTAGCDAYTVPFAVLRDFLAQRVMDHEEIERRVEADYSAELGISGQVLGKLGLERIKRLWVVEPEFIEFLDELRNSREFATINGEGLFRRFDRAGFGDIFFAPTKPQMKELRESKLPNLDSPLAKLMPLDTLYSLLAIGDFVNFQEEMDRTIRDSIEKLFQW